MMTEKMSIAMGYDSMGNNPDLVAAKDKDAEVFRASGDATCSVCGCKFIYHPRVQGMLWAVRTCKDRLVKL
jgi:hypothetical protein